MRILLLLLTLVVWAGNPAQAQFDKLKEQLNLGEDKDDKKEKKKDKPAFDLSSLLGGGDEEIEMEASYDYNFTIDWDVNSDDGAYFMTQLFNTEKNYMGMVVVPAEEDASVKKVDAIMDFDRSYLIAINPEDNQAMVMEFQNIEDQIEEGAATVNEEDFVLEKTNETKRIAGYLCTKYLYKGEDGNGKVFITTELDYENIDMFSYFKQLSQQKGQQKKGIWNSGVEGFMLEIDGVDADGSTYHMLATKVNTSANVSYNMEEYQTMDLRGMTRALGGFKN